MKKFQFSLSTVLGYKQQVQEGLQNEHAQLVHRVRQAEQRLEELEEAYRSCNRELREAEAKGTTVSEVLKYQSALRYWEQQIHDARAHLVQCRQAAEAKRAELVAARQETASLEKVRERKHEEYRYQIQKSEELFIEELVASQWRVPAP
ncbi:MAG TPA: flagellar export protein FliJ [Candidatus Avoscillospira avistercoris]|uniref:Flagellar FliJ protein n=1 Tax=Candidatus Avoscillospira avistercoris TaxID=2840707 RepID=A0A9D1FAD2_9FIRM|nr:flagellar export protein FliJ [Candidatus Avoscillospira avistercoris]